MNPNFIGFLFSVGTVTLAEMGDKTQLLAMAFATKYKAYKVLTGVFIATALNHALAVAVGNYITHFKSAQGWIQGIAALSFIFFGLWTLRGDRLDGEEKKATRFGAIVTVAAAFFIAEVGDKTQLATIALAAKFPASPVEILMGTTTGMLIADGIGIIVGVVMCKKIPDRIIKLISAGVFIFFGFLGSFQTAIERFNIGIWRTAGIFSVLGLLTGFTAYRLIKSSNEVHDKNAAAAKYCKIPDGEPDR